MKNLEKRAIIFTCAALGSGLADAIKFASSGLAFLFEGSIMLRDTPGNAVEIKPVAVNWMKAGKGIVHSERSPKYLRYKDKTMHGL